MITFQVSHHYLTKIALRLEMLLNSIQSSAQVLDANAHHLALLYCLEIIKLIEKPEFKSRFLKELMRWEHVLNKHQERRASSWLPQLADLIVQLSNLNRRMGEELLLDPLLQSMRSNNSASPLELDWDNPLLVYWFHQSGLQRQKNIRKWLDYLNLIQTTIHLYLTILRVNASFTSVAMSHGFYQEFLNDKQACSLIMLSISERLHLIPKIQIGHHGVSIRFYHAQTMHEAKGAHEHFELALGYAI